MIVGQVMKFSFILLSFVALSLISPFDYVSGRPVVHIITKICDARQFLHLYQRACTFFGKRQRQSLIHFQYGSFRYQRRFNKFWILINQCLLSLILSLCWTGDTSNELELDPAPELARKCCEEGCSAQLIALHCNSIWYITTDN